MAAATLSIRTIKGAQSETGDKGPFLLAAVQGVEGVSIPYAYDLTLYRLPTEDDVDPSEMIDTPAKFGIRHDHKYLTRCGVFRSFEKTGTTEVKHTSQTEFVIYRAQVVPAIAMLDYEQRFRVFERMDMPEILTECVGHFANIEPTRYFLKRFGGRTFPKLDYYVQYNESTLAFISRLLGEHGVWYYFEHPGPDDGPMVEQMVLGCGRDGTFTRVEEPKADAKDESWKFEVEPKNFTRRYEIAHRRTLTGDYNILKPTHPARSEAKVDPLYDAAPADDGTGLRMEREVFPAASPRADPAGDAHAMQTEATRYQEGEEATVFTVQGQGDNRRFRAGRTFTTKDKTLTTKLPAGKDRFGPHVEGEFLITRLSLSAMEHGLGHSVWDDVINILNPIHWFDRPDTGSNKTVKLTASIASTGLWQSVADESAKDHWYDVGINKLGKWYSTVAGAMGPIGSVISLFTDTINEIIDRHSDDYSNSFFAVPWTPGRLSLLPLPTFERPRVLGPQTAVVLGAKGADPATAELQVDTLNRVRVRFPWHAELPDGGEMDPYKTDRRTAWLRVADGWAGQGMGTQFLPRIGDEVIVSFLDGDPARPIVTGRVYNAANQAMGQPFPPKRSAAEPVTDAHVHTPAIGAASLRSGIRTRSSPRPKGAKDRFHLLRFDDAWQDEQLLLRSQGRTDVTSMGVWHDTSHGNRHIRVGGKDPDTGKGGGALLVTTGDEYDLHVGGDRYEGVDKGFTLSVKKNTLFDLEGNHSLMVGKGLQVSAGTVVVEASQKITLKVGGSFVVLDPAGVFIKGAMVQINSGGSPSSAGDVEVQDPLDAGTADAGDPPDWLALHPPGKGGGRTHHTARAQHGLLVTRNADGSLQVGRGIRIAGNPAYQDTVASQLALINATPAGQSMMDSYQAGNRNMTIQPNSPLPNPPNAFAAPQNATNAANGTGSDSTVKYDPGQWPNPVNAPHTPGDALLFHEMTHANHQGHGTQDMTPRSDNFDNNEEKNTIDDENVYRDQRGIPRRTDHHSL